MLGVVAGAAWLRYRGASPTAVTLRHARVLIAGNPGHRRLFSVVSRRHLVDCRHSHVCLPGMVVTCTNCRPTTARAFPKLPPLALRPRATRL
ncbi:hypothetical protein CBM2592_A260099 [Cupriavidus taiwanensis]|nr:hypothetical protein CBM2592_A260099 [Cupriavidus taiwanensis]SOY52025.1 hypothetical protein CBM2588_A210098 [Cupriavidus taiwanensis]SOZ59053.1 hypothetical protein CBM2617_A300099 [Cupriavidus taiwanensis]SOZ80194.1 hypothetical protein CBM2618_A270100 [Cupriavidus taiwanensis]SOZ80994.1 hypothetical protein CBM2622_A240098 [Cupriavidus taiwanensis]